MGPSHSLKYSLKLKLLHHRKLSRNYKDQSISQSVLFRQTMTTDCENYTERLNTPCG